MHYVLGLMLLLLADAKPAFEGTWTMEIKRPDGKKLSITYELKADGTFVSSKTDASGLTDKNKGKWKKTGLKTCEIKFDLLPNEEEDPNAKPDTFELLDAKTMQFIDPESKMKFKFTKK